MSEKRQIRAIRGTRDILPPESALWNRVEQAARDVFATYGYGEIRLPIFEQTELFARSVGADTDIVSKEMYTFSEQGRFAEPDSPAGARATSHPSPATVSLRPEATASVCRAYIEHGLQARPGDAKLYYIGPMFRRERPQKGRYRQFYQIGAEVLSPAPRAAETPAERQAMARVDAELIEMLLVFFRRVGLEVPLGKASGKVAVGQRGTERRESAPVTSHSPLATVFVNSIGCRNCRPRYVETLRAALARVKDQLGADSQRRIETNPLRVLDSKLESEQAVIEQLPRIADHLCDACRDHFAKFQDELNLRRIGYEVNGRLVRGLDYYTRTTFEIIAPGLGAQNAVCGGGRYDGLVELLGGPPTRGIGFAIGTDRLVLSLQELTKDSGHLVTRHSALVTVFLAWMGAAAYPAAVALARRLREAGIAVELPAEERKLRKSLELASKLGAHFALILGEDEVNTGQYTLKELATGEQTKLDEAALVARLGV
jgi:histidyl-tRNA synthetase